MSALRICSLTGKAARRCAVLFMRRCLVRLVNTPQRRQLSWAITLYLASVLLTGAVCRILHLLIEQFARRYISG